MERAGNILSAIFDSTNDVWFLVAPDYSILFFNKKAYENGKLLHNRELKAGDNILDYARDTKNEIDVKFVRGFERAINGEIVKTEEKIEYALHSIWVATKYIPVYEADVLLGISITVEDVTPQKLLEEERFRQQEEIIELSNKREEFINIASHELKTPLTSLKSSIQIISRKIQQLSGQDEIKVFVRRSEESVNKLNMLIKSLLDSSKITKGELFLNKRRFNLFHMIESCCSHILIDGDRKILVNGSRDLEVFADPEKLEQVVINFVTNAIKYAPETKEVLVDIERMDTEVKVSVRDAGQGIAADKLDHLFKRYYQGDPSVHHYSGMGLGLYIAEGIIRQHHGSIGVESEISKGSTFWFCIPIECK
jgi:signal transduction histidine kinase